MSRAAPMPARIARLNRRRLFAAPRPRSAPSAEWWALGGAVLVLLIVAVVGA